ncbi:unnamed protein product [Macrosiphum euphorbiae]|uniref:Uncharacterized protein n=1 Tax=Macrosiphum euphorbiae TaxID=13131 RepID=A0AAV0W1S5_9HEMI|nr:unnamed protein product [Macrosiphum euphorbiae]
MHRGLLLLHFRVRRVPDPAGSGAEGPSTPKPEALFVHRKSAVDFSIQPAVLAHLKLQRIPVVVSPWP